MQSTSRNPAEWPEDIFIVEKVESDDYWTTIIADSSGFGIANKHLTNMIQPGDEVVRYGGLGHTTKGIVVNGVVQFYLLKGEADMERAEWVAAHQRRKTREAEKNIEDYRQRVAKLYDPYRQRIQRFIDKQGEMNFWIEDSGYELFTLEQSDVMRRWALEKDSDNPVQALRDWNDLNSEKHNYNYTAQVAAMPGYNDGHSGNTHSSAVGLAIAVLEGKEI